MYAGRSLEMSGLMASRALNVADTLPFFFFFPRGAQRLLIHAAQAYTWLLALAVFSGAT